MKVFLIVCALLIPSIASGQYRLGSPVEATWDYTLADVTISGVLRFEIKIDNGPWVNTGLPPTATSYAYVIPAVSLPVGSHTVFLRACNSQECNEEPSPSIPFTVIRAVPKPPTNLKVQPGTVLVSNERILQLVQSYTLLIREEPIRENELVYLVTRYRGPIPPTYNDVMDYLDVNLLTLGW